MRFWKATAKHCGSSGTQRIGSGSGSGNSYRSAGSENGRFATTCTIERSCWGWQGTRSAYRRGGATIRSGTFQLQLGNTWCPEKIGAQQVNLPPGDRCRLWAEPDEELTDEELKKMCRSDASLGLGVMAINGVDVSIPV